MAEELFIPKLGQTVEEVTLINWLVQDGDKVKQGQEVLEVETDKAVFDVEAVDDGYIHIGPFKAGDVVPILEVVAVIGEKDDVFRKSEPDTAAAEPKEQVTESGQMPITEPDRKLDEDKTSSGDRIIASPRARKLAHEKNVDLSQVTATGGGGMRITEEDVLDFLSREGITSPEANRITKKQGIGQQKSSVSLPPMNLSKATPLSGVRGVIAQRMGLSAQTTARVTLFMEANATAFVSLREKLKAQYKAEWGFAPGYNELIAKICAIALRAYPYMNARINAATIEQLADVNIGIAVDAEQGLTVPVIKDTDQKDLRTIGTEFRQRVEEIRSGKIHPDHLTGGTFTITNLGMYDIDAFTPIINLPEAAILGIGRIVSKAIVLEDQITICKMLTLSLAFDHRLTDGAPAARFLHQIKALIEAPDEDSLLR